MAKTVASRKAKGRRLQNWIASKISQLLDLPWGKDEFIAPREMGQSGVDIRLVGEAQEEFPYSVEAKACERWSVPEFIKQAKDNQKENTEWLVICRKNHHEPIVIMDANHFFDLLGELHMYRLGNKDT